MTTPAGELGALLCQVWNLDPTRVSRIVVELDAERPPRAVVTFAPDERAEAALGAVLATYRLERET